MASSKDGHAEINEVRFVFDGEVVSLGFPKGATLADVACSLDTLAPRHESAPILIDMKLAAP